MKKDELKQQHTSITSSTTPLYTVTPIQPFGAKITGIDLSTAQISNALIESIRADIHKHELIVFKHQSPNNNFIVPPSKRLEIAQKLGTIISSHYHHPNAPHRDIFRVSNDAKKGCLNVGRTGWHLDGSFLPKPYNFSMMHIISAPKPGYGQTAFISSRLAVEQVLQKHSQLEELNGVLHRLYFVGTSPNHAIHPVIYPHPVTKKPTMLLHLGMTSAFIEVYDAFKHLAIDEAIKLHQQKDGDKKVLKVYDSAQTQQMLNKLASFIDICKQNGLMYEHQYETGDLLISDNMAVIHEAVKSTQYKPEQIGLRIMDRISIGDFYKPCK